MEEDDSSRLLLAGAQRMLALPARCAPASDPVQSEFQPNAPGAKRRETLAPR
ncbi:hypothetical protein [Burkholderia alba]|uniref:hypothetical protein n=1 Tax=Burkholderia alba TaxID=2683677 RepID=UPI002B05B5A0|nr:hypothetical protein [Burkholderia alba]